jgi:hypothetical protein
MKAGVKAADASPSPEQIEAEFSSTVPGVALYWQDQFWGELGPDRDRLRVNTFAGHVWNLRKGDTLIHTWTIEQPISPGLMELKYEE